MTNGKYRNTRENSFFRYFSRAHKHTRLLHRRTTFYRRSSVDHKNWRKSVVDLLLLLLLYVYLECFSAIIITTAQPRRKLVLRRKKHTHITFRKTFCFVFFLTLNWINNDERERKRRKRMMREWYFSWSYTRIQKTEMKYVVFLLFLRNFSLVILTKHVCVCVCISVEEQKRKVKKKKKKEGRFNEENEMKCELWWEIRSFYFRILLYRKRGAKLLKKT